MNLPELWKHQQQGIELARSKTEFAFIFDPGTGKTRTTIETLRHRYRTEGRILRTLIVCPLIVMRNWVDEFRTYTQVAAEKLVLLEGTGRERQNIVATELMCEDPGKIAICNYDGLATMPELLTLLTQWNPEIIVADEMHKLKKHTTKRAVAMYKLAQGSRFRYGLTGTAILNTPMDLYGQWLFLDRGKTFGTNFFAFRGHYFYDQNAGMPRHIHFPKWVIRGSAEEEIKGKIKAQALTAKKSEVLDLPPLIRQKILVEMPPEMAKHYKALKKDFVTWMSETQAVMATTALVKLLRLMQLTSGFVKTDSGEEIALKKDPKADALEELLENLAPHKTIVWASFIKNYDAIRKVCERLGLPYVECHGQVSNTKKFEAVEQFNKDPSIKVFIGHPASLGIGINLVAAKYMVYYSRSFSLEHDIQSEARNYRGGSEIHDSVTRYDLVMRDTVDELCLEALLRKGEIGESFIRAWAHSEK